MSPKKQILIAGIAPPMNKTASNSQVQPQGLRLHPVKQYFG